MARGSVAARAADPGPDAGGDRAVARSSPPHRIDDEDRERLDERFRRGGHAVARIRPLAESIVPAASPADGEVVLVMGLPGAGKSTIARACRRQGYARLNRDEAGGRCAACCRRSSAWSPRAVAIVLDNTYVSRASRAP